MGVGELEIACRPKPIVGRPGNGFIALLSYSRRSLENVLAPQPVDREVRVLNLCYAPNSKCAAQSVFSLCFNLERPKLELRRL